MTAADERHEASPYLVEDVIASLADAMILTDARGCVTVVNEATLLLLSCSKAQLVDRDVGEVFSRSPRLAQMVARTRELGHHQSSSEEMLYTRQGDIPVRASCSPIHGRGGGVSGTALVLHDLSYQRKLEDEARRNETLARLGTLVANLAHEIKNPLGGIRGAAQLLARRGGADGDSAAYTDVIVREVDRLAALVEQLLTFGAPRRPELQLVNVHKILHEVLTILGPEIENRGVIVRMEIDPSLPEVRVDQAQLTQVLLNLVKNGLDVLESGGRLTLATRLEMDFHIRRSAPVDDSGRSGAGSSSRGQFVRIGVADDGPGFPADLGETVFEPFVTTKVRGTGLGLAVCERIVAAHGGDIRAENRPEGGALVTVTLPVSGK